MKNVRVIVITTVLLCVRPSECVLLVLFFKILRLFFMCIIKGFFTQRLNN